MTVYSEHIGNTFGPKGFVDRLEPAHLVVKIAQIVLHEGDEPDALADLRDADVLAGKHVTEIDLPAMEADAAAVGHGERRVVERIAQVLEAAVDARRARIERRPARSSPSA